jgi:hypothetical protein
MDKNLDTEMQPESTTGASPLLLEREEKRRKISSDGDETKAVVFPVPSCERLSMYASFKLLEKFTLPHKQDLLEILYGPMEKSIAFILRTKTSADISAKSLQNTWINFVRMLDPTSPNYCNMDYKHILDGMRTRAGLDLKVRHVPETVTSEHFQIFLGEAGSMIKLLMQGKPVFVSDYELQRTVYKMKSIVSQAYSLCLGIAAGAEQRYKEWEAMYKEALDKTLKGFFKELPEYCAM